MSDELIQDERSSSGENAGEAESLPVHELRGGSLRAYAFLLGVSGGVIALDQASKALIRANLALGQTWYPLDIAFLRIVHWHNTGAAFGMFQDFGVVFTLLAFLVALAILYYFPRVPREDWPLRLAMGLQLGGAVGNLIDRLTIGWVTDFIAVGNFPVFNVADASISIGVAVLIMSVWVKDRFASPADPSEATPGLSQEGSAGRFGATPAQTKAASGEPMPEDD